MAQNAARLITSSVATALLISIISIARFTKSSMYSLTQAGTNPVCLFLVNLSISFLTNPFIFILTPPFFDYVLSISQAVNYIVAHCSYKSSAFINFFYLFLLIRTTSITYTLIIRLSLSFIVTPKYYFQSCTSLLVTAYP